MKSYGQVVVTMTGNEHVRVSDLRGKNIRYRGVLCPTQAGVRMTRREWPKASQARTYKDRVLARLKVNQAIATANANAQEDRHYEDADYENPDEMIFGVSSSELGV